MQYGTGVTDADWDALMNRARRMATSLGTRIKVKAGISGLREQRRINKKYVYITMLPLYTGTARCGKPGPNGKPCIRYASHCIDGREWSYHVSRTSNSDERIAWGRHYPTNKIIRKDDYVEWTGELA